MKKKQWHILSFVVFICIGVFLGYYFFDKAQNESTVNSAQKNSAQKDGIRSKSYVGTTTVKNIHDVNFEAFLNDAAHTVTLDYKDCGPDAKPVTIDGVGYADLNGDGKEEAIVQASSCFRGTAGSDINSIYTLSPSGEVTELNVNDNGGVYKGKKLYENSWKDYGYTVENNKLVNTRPIYKDSDPNCCPSGGSREIVYDWNGKEFVISKVTEDPEGN